MVDPINNLQRERNYKLELEDTAAHTYSPFKICSCERCRELIYPYAVQPKFLDYSKFDPDTVPNLSTHQYFICYRTVVAFVFRLRSWGESP